ncbi:restriction endonuclease [Lutibacter sp. B2]|nr:restriction endonuclease [Lutibacter sp. B2]
MLKIFDKEPVNWQDLQIKVGKIFSDMNYLVEVEKNIQTVREDINVDVYAESSSSFAKEIVIAECKNWNTSVPKTIVHSFRTVISDIGANTGYIISKSGFQNGAYTAAKNSNIYLMNYDELQSNFRERWLEAMVFKMHTIGYPLKKYADGMENFVIEESELLSSEKYNQFKKLSQKYDRISMCSIITMYKNPLTGKLELNYIDDIIERNVKNYFPKNIKVNCLSDYFDYLITTFSKGVDEFDNLFGKKLRKR